MYVVGAFSVIVKSLLKVRCELYWGDEMRSYLVLLAATDCGQNVNTVMEWGPGQLNLEQIQYQVYLEASTWFLSFWISVVHWIVKLQIVYENVWLMLQWCDCFVCMIYMMNMSLAQRPGRWSPDWRGFIIQVIAGLLSQNITFSHKSNKLDI